MKKTKKNLTIKRLEIRKETIEELLRREVECPDKKEIQEIKKETSQKERPMERTSQETTFESPREERKTKTLVPLIEETQESGNLEEIVPQERIKEDTEKNQIYSARESNYSPINPGSINNYETKRNYETPSQTNNLRIERDNEPLINPLGLPQKTKNQNQENQAQEINLQKHKYYQESDPFKRKDKEERIGKVF